MNDRTFPALIQAARLVEEAEQVLLDLDLLALAGTAGEVLRIGSAAAGVMAVRDIDLGVLCPRLDAAPVFAIAERLFAHPRVRRVTITDERPPFQSMPGPEDEGIYCGIRYCDDARREPEWKIDLWFFPAEAPRPELAIRDRLRAASDAERDAIVRCKLALVDAGRYGAGVAGIDVYRAVLDRGEESLEDVVRTVVGGTS